MTHAEIFYAYIAHLKMEHGGGGGKLMDAAGTEFDVHKISVVHDFLHSGAARLDGDLVSRA